ncbi:MAG: hypothetical protein IPH91_03650 [Elusimicrobia bacterium]|nr:hypothetical protein [Elusimicrobiota bacterium]MBK7689229.1 hypothetical protein [Elusimicrobiota bacterium]MBK8651450.1 hypothetical protein [Elusimicrobiota bacterium]
MKKALLALAILAGSAWAYQGDVQNIPPREYFETVQREISKAKTSISLYMYLFSLQPYESQSEVFLLAQALKKAHDTGVKVEVVLDQNYDFTGEEGASVEAKNLAAYTYLRKSGISVYFDDAETYTHAKALIIDGETMITGSSNWSRAAFELNEETNVLVRSKDAARDMLKTLQAIKREEPPNSGPAVPVPAGFLLDNELFGRMVSQPDERAFDIYLFLAREKPGTINLDYDKLAVYLGINSMSREAYRRQINKVLGKLQDRYRLISVSKSFNKEAEITMLLVKSQDSVSVPVAYWELGWNRRLSFAGKAFYLINLRESAGSPIQPRWSLNLENIAKRYGTSPWFISQGVTDLRRNNLLEVEYGQAGENGPGDRAPNVYTSNPLYDPKELGKKLEDLKKQYGAAKVERAQSAASLVYEDSYLHGIKQLIELEDRYGMERIARATKILGAKSGDNPKRTIGYLIRTIQDLK